MKTKKLMMLSLLGLVALAGCKPKTSESSTSQPPVSDSSAGESSEAPPAAVLANGVKNFAAANMEDKSEILQKLETYTLDNHLAGVPYRDDSGYQMFNPRVALPTDDYVVGYGFGVHEATLSMPLTGSQVVPAQNMYFHTWLPSGSPVPHINAMNGQDSTTLELQSMLAEGLWSTRFNADKTGYEWYPALAQEGVERPIPIGGLDSDGMAKKWRVPVRIDDALKYNTLSTVPAVKAFDGRKVALEDYLTPYKLTLDNEWFRATDLSKGNGAFVGAADYLDAQQKDWSVVGIQINEDEQALEFEFVSAKTPFQAMYNLASGMFTPIPADFIDEIGGASKYGLVNIDSMLSLGVYTLERFETSTGEIIMKKNPHYLEASRYKHAGVVYKRFDSGANANIAFDEFLAGNIDSAGVPSSYLSQYKNNPNARQTKGATVLRINTNHTTQERWNELFGPNGTINANSDWEVKPIMGSSAFMNGLYLSLDRQTLADNVGSRPAQAFLSEAYMLDEELGLSWRESDAGKAVLDGRSPETHGYSEEAAKAFFADAIEEVKAQYPAGTAANPTTIEIEFRLFTVAQFETEGNPIKTQIEKVFNAVDPAYKLNINLEATNPDDAYDAMEVGEFDLAYGAIQGSTLNPLGFMEVLRSDNSTGFTLSWGTDTSLPSEALTIDNEIYSFDALQSAATKQTIISEGQEVAAHSFLTAGFVPSAVEGKYDFHATGKYFADAEYVIEPDEEGTYYETDAAFVLDLWKSDGKSFLAEFEVEITKWEDGSWEASALELTIPAETYFIEVILSTTHTYKGEVTPAVLYGLFIWG